MSMSGISVTSDKSLELESTQNVYHTQIARLNRFGMDNQEHNDAILSKMKELAAEERSLSDFSANELRLMKKELTPRVDTFLLSIANQAATK